MLAKEMKEKVRNDTKKRYERKKTQQLIHNTDTYLDLKEI